MLRRFNSLIKGPKGVSSDEEAAVEHVSLRPARSVDSSLFFHPRTGENLLARRVSEAGQTSLNVAVHEMRRVPEERVWKEGYEQANLDSPGTPQEQYEPGEKPREDGGAAQSVQIELPRISRTSSDAVVLPISRTTSHTVVDIIPDSAVDLEDVRNCSAATTGPGRTISSWSTDSAAEHCRICQQYSEEPLIDLGCLCRGEMAKSHKSCIETWFMNKGTNKCEVCQHVASNIPAPVSSPMPHFWVWRLGGQNAHSSAAAGAAQNRVAFQSGLLVNRPVLLMIIKKHPLIPVMWLSLLAFMTYLFVDAINTATIGYAAMPIGFLFGVLVVLGVGTAVRLVMECCNERAVDHSIRQMELLSPDPEPTVQAGAQESSAVQNQPGLPP